MFKRSILIVGSSIGFLFVANQGAHALSWNWSLVDFNGQTSSGTFTTDGTSYQAGTTYNITGITGTSNIGSIGHTIAGLNSLYAGASNILQWDGTNSSPLISDGGGIAWDNDDGQALVVFSFSGVYAAVNYTVNTYYPYGLGSITSSTLTPAVPFEFDPEQGFILGVPLFLGLRKLKKKSA